MATLEEIERSWSRRDIFDANDLLDAFNEAREDAESEPTK